MKKLKEGMKIKLKRFNNMPLKELDVDDYYVDSPNKLYVTPIMIDFIKRNGGKKVKISSIQNRSTLQGNEKWFEIEGGYGYTWSSLMFHLDEPTLHGINKILFK